MAFFAGSMSIFSRFRQEWKAISSRHRQIKRRLGALLRVSCSGRRVACDLVTRHLSLVAFFADTILPGPVTERLINRSTERITKAANAICLKDYSSFLKSKEAPA